jgi:hypothetical protein
MEKKTYSEKLQDPRWQEVRGRILKRDGYRCRDSLDEGYQRYAPPIEMTDEERESAETFDDGIELHVHHTFYEKGDPWDTGDEYLICVGNDEHAARHVVEDRIKRAVAKICANTRNKPGSGDYGDLGHFAKTLEGLADSARIIDGDTVKARLQPIARSWHYTAEEAKWISIRSGAKGSSLDDIEKGGE